ncbi:hypothetical protein T552_02502 [Pneumocystis carinii B80]|uniref:Uncharacterized protein n=1 Tax=Pneumocystis carinii (strain B80) TaxID=1408658 RepID=A0A0W4ZF67_PNEC8|nr:hypothetical protein T552_02502 [Pneumocystis carinii B80]KTW27010.1 hypothetical protein T552_02502 [Pneumocystis carinii B80]
MGVICCKTKKYTETHLESCEQEKDEKMNTCISSKKNKSKSSKKGYTLSKEKNTEKAEHDISILREAAANAAQARFEKNKNKGISSPGKLSSQLAAEKKKTRIELLEDISREKQIERDQKQMNDLRWD